MATATALAVAVGGFFVVSGSSDADDEGTTAAYSYATATTTIDAAAALRTTMAMRGPGMTADAVLQVDRASRRFAMDLTMTSDQSGDVGAFNFENLDFAMIGDPAANLTYVTGELYSSLLDLDTTWISMTDEQGGGDFDSGEWFDPLDMVAMFAGYEPVEVGIETSEPLEIELPDPADVTDWVTAMQSSPWGDISELAD